MDSKKPFWIRFKGINMLVSPDVYYVTRKVNYGPTRSILQTEYVYRLYVHEPSNINLEIEFSQSEIEELRKNYFEFHKEMTELDENKDKEKQLSERLDKLEKELKTIKQLEKANVLLNSATEFVRAFEKKDKTDYRTLLKKYIHHVGDIESVDYLDEAKVRNSDFTEQELKILRKLSHET